jgi:cytidylate kinase
MMNRPGGPTVAVSREPGARGAEVADAVGRALGWPVYPQEMLDFLARDEAARAELVADLPTPARLWAEAEHLRLVKARGLAPTSDTAAVARLILTLAARGGTVLVGRGAGFVLPPESTVHVRVVAPLADRVAYTSQRYMLSAPEAAAEVAGRDRRRAEFLAAFTDLDPADPTGYDLVVNSSRLGLDGCVELVAAAVRAKTAPVDSTEFDPAEQPT